MIRIGDVKELSIGCTDYAFCKWCTSQAIIDLPGAPKVYIRFSSLGIGILPSVNQVAFCHKMYENGIFCCNASVEITSHYDVVTLSLMPFGAFFEIWFELQLRSVIGDQLISITIIRIKIFLFNDNPLLHCHCYFGGLGYVICWCIYWDYYNWLEFAPICGQCPLAHIVLVVALESA